MDFLFFSYWKNFPYSDILIITKGTVIITHGRAKRRMIGFACDVAATTARTRVPALIAEALAEGPA